ncbi:MAG TPA: DUF4349 domain-containing protein [Anaerolineae bacterium]|nr:DUF4349 domain-containing protein [Anaerolineae bacterium]
MKKYWIWALVAAMLVMTGCGARVAEEAAVDKGIMPSTAPGSGASFSEVNQDAAAGDITPMIVYNGSLELVVSDALQAQEDVQRVIEGVNGYVVSSESYRYEQGLITVNMRVRVPAEKFHEVMAQLRNLALEVNHDSTSSEDVTQEYVDLESKLRALEAKAARLEELMKEAEDTEAVLAVYRELSATQQEIEQVKGRMQYLERSSAMATISVTLTPDELSRPVEVAGWRPQGTAKRAVEALLNTLKFLGNALIWIVIYIVPVLAVVGGVVYLVRKGWSRLFGRRKRAAKTAELLEAPEAK